MALLNYNSRKGLGLLRLNVFQQAVVGFYGGCCSCTADAKLPYTNVN